MHLDAICDTKMPIESYSELLTTYHTSTKSHDEDHEYVCENVIFSVMNCHSLTFSNSFIDNEHMIGVQRNLSRNHRSMQYNRI